MKKIINLKIWCILFLVTSIGSNVTAQEKSSEIGYPKPAHFKRISWESMDDLMFLDQVVVGTIGKNYRDHEKMAIEFKKRKPSATVLVQYYWDAYPRIYPLQIVKNNGFYDRYDSVYYAYPKFNGYFLPVGPAKIKNDVNKNQDKFTVAFDEIPDIWLEKFKKTQNRVNGSKIPFAMIYALNKNGEADFESSEFIKMHKINKDSKTVEFHRFPETKHKKHFAYQADKARIGIQTLTANHENAWHLNFSKFCPKDPETGMTATEYMAKHLANYYRERISGIDGFSFDVPNYHPMEGLDINNDGVADDGYYNNINYNGLGIHDFYYNLRYGSKFDKGLGDDIVLVQDGQFMTDQRFADLLNGCENEDFPSMQDWKLFSSAFNIHMWWADRARKPNASFLAMRYPTDAYHNPDDTDKLTQFMSNGAARVGIATACFGNGVAVYESTRVWKRDENGKFVSLIYGDAEMKVGKKKPYILPQDYYMWDEYSGGNKNDFDWLGLPIEERKYVTSNLGEDLLKNQSINNWGLSTSDNCVQINNYSVDNAARSMSYKINFTDLPKNKWVHWGDVGLVQAVSTIIQSDVLPIESKNNTEFCVSFTGLGKNAYPDDNERYKKIPISVGFRLVSLDTKDKGTTQFVFADPIPRDYSLTLVSPKTGKKFALEILSGIEPGAHEINNISLREGSAEVIYRKFENGIVLMNASKDNGNSFNLDEIDPSVKYKKLDGVVDSKWNDGSKVHGTIEIPAFNALFLKKR